MSTKPNSFINQLRNNILAILSLSIAISALGYNSWRNELSEQNRNTRYAGFEIIKETSKLQNFLDQTTFTKQQDQSNTPIEGWVRIRLIRSLSMFMNNLVQDKAELLYSQWRSSWQDLSSNEMTNRQLSLNIEALIQEVRLELSLLR
ncbi:MAG: hypothetical protein COB38_08860 [Gammaproteobacteria bacterium]|nr:MAG: hypothetical protein COB38_08860 [Gammaproteobacteria bacterium]